MCKVRRGGSYSSYNHYEGASVTFGTRTAELQASEAKHLAARRADIDGWRVGCAFASQLPATISYRGGEVEAREAWRCPGAGDNDRHCRSRTACGYRLWRYS
jgi:hypothetical protein